MQPGRVLSPRGSPLSGALLFFSCAEQTIHFPQQNNDSLRFLQYFQFLPSINGNQVLDSFLIRGRILEDTN